MACDRNSNKLVNHVNNVLGVSKYCVSIGACVSFVYYWSMCLLCIFHVSTSCMSNGMMCFLCILSKYCDSIGACASSSNDCSEHETSSTTSSVVSNSASLLPSSLSDVTPHDYQLCCCYMKSKAEVAQVLKLFAKEVGMICVKSGDHFRGDDGRAVL